MRQSIAVALAGFAVACSSPKYTCSVDTDCPASTKCDTSQKLCYIPGGCTEICKSNEACVAAACVAQACPTCNANEICNDTTFKCEAVTDGTISMVSPAAGGVIGGAQSTVTARAGAPNGGPLHVDFVLNDSGGKQLSTVSVATGDAQGNYTGTLDLSTATTSTGNTLVATVFWHDAQGAVQQKSTGATTVTIDKTPPSITGISTDKPWYSTVANPTGTATVTATIVDSGGSSGVDAKSVQLTVGSNPPIAGALQTGSNTVFQFALPLSQLAAGANTITLKAADIVNNSGTQTGTVNVDNTAPVFGTTVVPTAFFSCSVPATDVVTPALTAAITDSGGSDVDPASLKIKVGTSTLLPATSFTSGTATWSGLHGSDFLGANQQQAVSFDFVGSDVAGNPATAVTKSLNVDCKAPVVGTVGGSGTTAWVQGPTRNGAGTATVTAIVDDTGGSGPASAALQIAGQSDVSGTTGGTGASRTYSFSVPVTVQAAGSEAPVAFDIIGTDAVGNVTPLASAATGSILIDDLGPSVNVVTVTTTGFVDDSVPAVHWFPQSQSTDVSIQANIFEAGSGLNASSLQLQVPSAVNTRLDHGTPTCGPSGTANVQTCTFKVQPNAISATIVGVAPFQGAISFVVAGADNVGNPVRSGTANAGKVGIDGVAPTVTFSITGAGATTSYPAAPTLCTSDSTIYCGHDGNHFWRKGEPATTRLSFTIVDGSGSGPKVGSSLAQPPAQYWFTNATGGACSPTNKCTARADGGSTYSLSADLSSAPFTSDVAGVGTISISVNGQDNVGNQGVAKALSVNVTRVKWMRTMASKVDTFKAAPVVTGSGASEQIILGGAEAGDTLGPIVALSADGAVLWRAGHGDVDKITTNIAYSSTTHTMYVVSDPALTTLNNSKMFAYNTAGLTSDGTCAKASAQCLVCGLSFAGQTGKVFGAPALLNDGGVEYALIADQSKFRLFALNAAFGTSCSGIATTGAIGGNTAWSGGVSTPSVSGSSIYVPHGTNGLAKLTFSGGIFGATDTDVSTAPTIFGQVSIATNLFFGDQSAPGRYYDYDPTSLSSVTAWTNNTNSGKMNAGLTASPVVSTSFLFGSAKSGDGRLRAFNLSDGSEAFHYPPGAGGSGVLGAFSAAALDTNNVIYASEDSVPSLQPIASDGSGFAPGWTVAYQGAVTSPDSTLDSITTEPTIDGSGVMYFGTVGGKIYALITESTGPLAPSSNTWPRVGFDNCNSSNTAFTCQ